MNPASRQRMSLHLRRLSDHASQGSGPLGRADDSTSEPPEPPAFEPLPPPGSPGRISMLQLENLGRTIEPVYATSECILDTARDAATAPPLLEPASRGWQLTYNYLTGAGVYSGSFAIGSLVAASVNPLSPVAAAVLFNLVAPLLHGSMGEAVGMMIRKNHGAAYGSPDTEAWRVCSDALADWLRARCAGDGPALADACERYNTEVLRLWPRWGRPGHTDPLGPAEAIDLRARLIDLRTPLKAMGMGFLVDEVAFAWFAIAYAGAGRLAVELLGQVARDASEWGLREAYRFSLYNFFNHLGWGALMGGAFTTVQQNALRSLACPDAARPDGGVQSTQARDRRVAALRERIDALNDHHLRLSEAAAQRAIALAPEPVDGDELCLVLHEAMAMIEAAVARRGDEISQLKRLGELNRRQRDDQTFRANLRALFSPPLRRNQVARLAANVLSLAPYVDRMRRLALTNADHARALVAQGRGGPAVTAGQAQPVVLANTFMGAQLIGFWYTRTFVQTGLKLGHGIGAGLYQRWRAGAADPGPTDEVIRLPEALRPPSDTGPGHDRDSARSDSSDSSDSSDGRHDRPPPPLRGGSGVHLESPVGSFFIPADEAGDGDAPPRIPSVLEAQFEQLRIGLERLRLRHGEARLLDFLDDAIEAIRPEIEFSAASGASGASGDDAPPL